jgi:hypothetical protein
MKRAKERAFREQVPIASVPEPQRGLLGLIPPQRPDLMNGGVEEGGRQAEQDEAVDRLDCAQEAPAVREKMGAWP